MDGLLNTTELKLKLNSVTCKSLREAFKKFITAENKMLSYRRKTALQGVL